MRGGVDGWNGRAVSLVFVILEPISEMGYLKPVSEMGYLTQRFKRMNVSQWGLQFPVCTHTEPQSPLCCWLPQLICAAEMARRLLE